MGEKDLVVGEEGGNELVAWWKAETLIESGAGRKVEALRWDCPRRKRRELRNRLLLSG